MVAALFIATPLAVYYLPFPWGLVLAIWVVFEALILNNRMR